ncbi:14276_t:CDS:2, partial [Ambispora leptoticha]
MVSKATSFSYIQENSKEKEIDWTEFFQLEFGFIFSDYGIEKAKKKAFDIVELPDMTFNDTVTQKTYSLSQHNLKEETFIAFNDIAIEPNSIERFLNAGLIHNCSMKYWFNGEESKLTNYIYFTIDISKDHIKLSESYSKEIQKLTEYNNPYPKLRSFFKEYGYFYESKVTIGAKFDRSFESYSKYFCDKINKSNLSKDDLQSYLNEFEESVKPFDSSYLCDYNLYLIKIKNIAKWLIAISDLKTEWKMFKRQVTPLYHNLEEPIRKQLDYLLGSKSHILMFGRVQVNDCKRIKFSEPLHEASYHIFGRTTCESDKKAVPKFKYLNVEGFEISIESSENVGEIQSTKHIVTWIMVGIPYKIGYSNPSVRNLEILIGSVPVKERKAELKVNQTLCPGYILTTSFIYPYSKVEPNFDFEISSWSSQGIISLEIIGPTNDDFLDNNDKESITLSWCLIQATPTKLEKKDSRFAVCNHVGHVLKQQDEKKEVNLRINEKKVINNLGQIIKEHFINLRTEKIIIFSTPKDNNCAVAITRVNNDYCYAVRLVIYDPIAKDIRCPDKNPVNVDGFKKALRQAIDIKLDKEVNDTLEIKNLTSQNARTILLIGRTGSGKSTLANVFTNTTKFLEDEFMVEETCNNQSEEVVIEGIRYNILDTPGFAGTKFLPEEIYKKIAEGASQAMDSLYQIFFVTDGKLTQEETDFYNLLRTIIFDENVGQYTTLVHTHFPSFRDKKLFYDDINNMNNENNDIANLFYSCRDIIYVNNPPLNEVNNDIEMCKKIRNASRVILINTLSTCGKKAYRAKCLSHRIKEPIVREKILQRDLEVIAENDPHKELLAILYREIIEELGAYASQQA